MLRFGARLRLRFLGILFQEATFARRGFRDGGVGTRQRLEESGKTFLQGYLTALEEDSPEALAVRLNALGPEFRGFAFEGAYEKSYLDFWYLHNGITVICDDFSETNQVANWSIPGW